MENKIKTAKEILRGMEVSLFNKEGTQEFFYVDTDEDHVANAMIVYAQQFIDLADEQVDSGNENYENKVIILNIKQQIQ